MKRFKLIDVVIALLFLGILILAICGYLSNAHAEDYIITYYSQGVFSIEHDGVIHVMGRGKPDKGIGENEGGGPWGRLSETEPDAETYLKWAEAKEAGEDFFMAAIYYRRAGDIGKMEEMAYKDIDIELAKDPPNYRGVMTTIKDILKDKDLAMEYYEKYLDQQFSE